MYHAFAFAGLLLASTAIVANAQQHNSKPQPLPIVDTIPDARDIPYPGTIKLDIDATDTRRAIFSVKETIPVAKSGPMTLLMPAWLPGNHSVNGQVDKLVELAFTANGKPIVWKRDPVDVFAFHIDVPEGATSVIARFKFVSATAENQGRIVMTPDLLNLQWESVSLYPAGYFTRQIAVDATVIYPEGFVAASALPSTRQGSTYRYGATNYEILVDSPVFAGRYYKKWALSDDVDLNVFADTPDQLAAKDEQIAAHRRLVAQAVKLFGAQHYDHYQFLLAISDKLGKIGLEHHRSSENNPGLGYFIEADKQPGSLNLLPHEFTHSWNGKFRRGADLWTPDFRAPMRDSLLWVYEGQTQFWGYVLQARSGIVSKQNTLDAYALIAANLDTSAGRKWRPLVDTTNDPIISDRAPKGWTSVQRSEDYYNEGMLIWLTVDAKLRELSGGTKSMDDFARAFFGINDRDWGEVTYNFDDVITTLNGIQPYGWGPMLHKLVDETSNGAPLTGLTDNGYTLVYTDEPTDYFKANEERRKYTDFSYSLGMSIGKEDKVTNVEWGSPAFDAGITVGDTVKAADGNAYSADALKAMITAAKTNRAPIKLLILHGTGYENVAIDYHDGLRYPRLEKTTPGEGGLDRLLTAR